MSNLSSDYDSSFATESDVDHEYFFNEEPSKGNICLPNYTSEVENIIQENVDVSTANAIRLNHHYQAKLRELRAQLETLLCQCQTRLKEVDSMVDSIRNNPKECVPYRVRAPGYICGQPYFKDHQLYPGPHNADYLYRKNVQKEFFPLDMFELTETHWTRKDKQNIKNGIRGQAVQFLRRESTLLAKKCHNEAKAACIRQEILSYNNESLEEIWAKVQAHEETGGEKFNVDWLVLSNVHVLGRHTATACEAMWNQYLKPGLRKGPWQPQEECRLVSAVNKHNYQDWCSIAQAVSNRSEYQCFVHYRSYFSQQAQIERKPWTPEEDALLLRVVQQNRIGSNVVWNKVVENMPYRNKIQVYHRYKYTLMRPIKNARFTAEEDCVITAYVQQYGDDFKFFPEHLLPGRTMKQIWARYNNTLRYVDKRVGWSLDEDRRLMSYIAEHLTPEGGPEKISWSDCSRHLSNHSRASCRSRYYTIEKFLEKFPNATLDDVPRRERKKLSTDVTNDNWMNTILAIKSMTRHTERSSSVDDRLCPAFKTTGEWELYEQMKFSFRYQFGHKLSVDGNRRHVHTATKLLLYLLVGFHETEPSTDGYFLGMSDHRTMVAVLQAPFDARACLGVGEKRSKKKFKGELGACRLPPNYNTVLGLRGVCLSAFYEPKPTPGVSGRATKKAKASKNPLYDHALALFVERFKKLFHWSMLLTMLNIEDVQFEADAPTEPTISLKVDTSETSGLDLPSTSGQLCIAAPSAECGLGSGGVAEEMETHHLLSSIPQIVSVEQFSLQEIAARFNGRSEGNVELVNKITIIDPSDLPVPSDNSLELRDMSVVQSSEEQSVFVDCVNTCDDIGSSHVPMIASNYQPAYEVTYSAVDPNGSQPHKSIVDSQLLFTHGASIASSFKMEPIQFADVQDAVAFYAGHRTHVLNTTVLSNGDDATAQLQEQIATTHSLSEQSFPPSEHLTMTSAALFVEEHVSSSPDAGIHPPSSGAHNDHNQADCTLAVQQDVHYDVAGLKNDGTKANDRDDKEDANMIDKIFIMTEICDSQPQATIGGGDIVEPTNRIRSEHTISGEETLEQDGLGSETAENCPSSSLAAHYEGPLLGGTAEQALTAVDIIRMLNERRQNSGSEAAYSEVEEGEEES